MIIQSDEGAKESQKDSERNLEVGRTGVGEGGVSHEACGVYHVQLIDQLPRICVCQRQESGSLGRGHTFEGRVEHEAAKADQKIAKVRNLEDGVMAMFSAAFDALVGEIDEHEVGQGVDDLGGIVGGIVVLGMSGEGIRRQQMGELHFFTPLKG